MSGLAAKRDAVGGGRRARFDRLAQRISVQRDAIEALAETVSDPGARTAFAALAERTGRHAPRISIVGQVKAGKTVLANALAGSPGLLPSDVNPWTSALTALHVNQPWRQPRALFRFFSNEDWDRLVAGGGRLGELAERADMDVEAATLRDQVTALRQAAAHRLGDRFEGLLGNSHSFDYVDRALVERYVCVGDEEAGNRPGTSGRYSELTKTANLCIDAPDCPIALTICDTPGVNDTFLVREQLTLEALEDTDLCVIVLSAHQAMSSADVGLLRLFSALRPEQLVIFVNRVDELADPARQTAEIAERIGTTLTRCARMQDVPVVFGSAFSAEVALAGDPDALAGDGIGRLIDWRLPGSPAGSDAAWAASGIENLLDEIAAQLDRGKAAEPLVRTAVEALGLALTCHSLSAQPVRMALDTAELTELLDPLVAECQQSLHAIFDKARKSLRRHLKEAASRFVSEQEATLVESMKARRPRGEWVIDADALRNALAQVYDDECEAVARRVSVLLAELSTALGAVYEDAIGRSPRMAVPPVPHAPAPISLAGTMAIDAEMPWWRSWFGRQRAIDSALAALGATITAEATALVEELCGRQFADFSSSVSDACAAFLDGHATALFDLAEAADAGERASVLERAGVEGDPARLRRLEEAVAALETVMPATAGDRSAAA